MRRALPTYLSFLSFYRQKKPDTLKNKSGNSHVSERVTIISSYSEILLSSSYILGQLLIQFHCRNFSDAIIKDFIIDFGKFRATWDCKGSL